MNKYKQHHMSKAELKTNKILDFAVLLRHSFIKNKTNFLRGSIVVIVLLILWAVMLNNRSKKEAKGMLLFENAYSILRNPKLIETKINKADKILNKVVAQYPDTFAAAKAHYYIGNIKFQLRSYKLAITHYTKVINYGSGTYLYPASLVSAGDSCAQLRQYSRAINYYNRVIVGSAGSGFTASARMKKFYCLMQTKKYKLAAVELIEIKKSGSQWAAKAEKWDTYLGLYLPKASKAKTP